MLHGQASWQSANKQTKTLPEGKNTAATPSIHKLRLAAKQVRLLHTLTAHAIQQLESYRQLPRHKLSTDQ